MRQKAAVSAGAHAQAWHVISLVKLIFWGPLSTWALRVGACLSLRMRLVATLGLGFDPDNEARMRVSQTLT